MLAGIANAAPGRSGQNSPSLCSAAAPTFRFPEFARRFSDGEPRSALDVHCGAESKSGVRAQFACTPKSGHTVRESEPQQKRDGETARFCGSSARSRLASGLHR
jgi:hypothetical protein